MIKNFGNAEMHYIPMEEIEKDYRKCDWSCWTQAVPFVIAVIDGIYIIAKLAIIIHWQLDASL